MSAYIKGILVAFVEPVVHAWANIIDSNLSNTVFPKLSILVFFGSIVNIILLPIVALISPIHILTPLQTLLVFGITLAETLYLFPYYWSLRIVDTSVVTSLFTLGDILVPILAFIILGETLALSQYVGFFLVIASAIGLTLDFRKLRFNRAFIYMLLVGIMLAFRAILLKFVFDSGATWGSFMVYLAVFQFCIAIVFVLFAGKEELVRGIASIRKVKGMYFLDELFSWLGNSGNSFALTLLPVPIVQGIGATQPAFVLITAYLFRKRNPEFFRETLDRKTIVRKILFFVLTIIGVVLVVR